uniref:(northern house mosquito) hypothetical protein n=1 Tax=Culex pipiens TaxID=7175 RepID=A0A8D8MPF8_CULPI
MIDKSANLRTRLWHTRSHQLSRFYERTKRTHIRGFEPSQHPPNHILKTVGLLLWHREARIFPVASVVILLLLLFFQMFKSGLFPFALCLLFAPHSYCLCIGFINFFCIL